ncbi:MULTISPECIES: formylmethanofuran dehydrogenase subunit B [Methanobacterium]|jgi:formylmethanofuran dehydrogenase subunit B|uniref:Formylmethanofuran dehydrogenase subunit B n=1 Tax=Methanobacterium veterum TaxID=408577 RepID=A0A9E4ZWK7_9EURY|nr:MULTISPECIES: formylmethanofuran dehydrogenase subunit B [Methanobacterium]MCZ3365358.1 formylmethanofuran dehydrogenase subunit B [Methanobacterium veterum]MCZ3373109.1 formylmethanofuran dehydrogenase subunit B [Methanobacterium veterum]
MANYEEPITDYDEIVENCTCAFCGCNCDDLDYLVKDGHVVAVRHACRLGASKIMEDMDQRLLVPMIRNEEGELEEVDWDAALDKAAELIAGAVRPVFYGWSETSIETMHHGLELGELVGAVLDNQATICHGPSIQAVQNVGYPIFTLGEGKNRADMVVYTGSNAMNSHPRHMARYSTFPRGYFRPRGRYDRTVVTMDPKYSDTAKMSDVWIGFEQNGDYEFYNAIRAVLKGKKLKKDVISGIPKEDIYELTEKMKNAQFGTLYFGLGLTHTLSKQRNIDIAIQMIADLNKYSKWVLMPMRGHFNVNGFNIFMSYETGFPYGVDFSRGYQRYMNGETNTIDLLTRKECDVFMVIAADPGAHYPGGAVKHLAEIPVIQIDIHWGPSTEIADVVLPGSFIGVEAAGTSYRMDGVPIYMKKAIDKPETCRDDEWIVKELLERVKKIKAEQGTSQSEEGALAK